MKRLAAILILTALAGTACWPFDGEDSLGEMSLRRERGEVQVIRGEEVFNINGGIDLEPGDVIKTNRDGSAELRLEGERTARLLPRSEALVVDVTALEARAGSLIADVEETMTVTFAETTARSSEGIFRVDRGFASTTVGSYGGSVDLSAPGERDLRVDEFFQAPVAAGDLPAMASPYELDLDDPWDRQYLKPVVQLETELTTLSRALSNSLGKDRPGLPYFASLAGGRQVGFMRPYLRDARVDDLLIGFTVAETASGSNLKDLFETAFGYFDQGARWAIVAAIMDVDSRPLVAQLDEVILDTRVADRGRGSEATFTLASSSTDPEDPPDDPRDPPEDPPEDPEDPKKPKNPPEECENAVDCTVEDILPGGGDPSPSPSPTDLIDALIGD